MPATKETTLDDLLDATTTEDEVKTSTTLNDKVEELNEPAAHIVGQHPLALGEFADIHFIADGLTAFGNVWVRGQSLQIRVGGDTWQTTVDASGKSWLEKSRFDQIETYGEHLFDYGLWPFDLDEGYIRSELAELKYAPSEIEKAIFGMKNSKPKVLH